MGILSLSQQEEEKTIWCQKQIIMLHTKFFTKDLLAIEMKKTDILMNKPVYLILSILELSKILMYEFWYDYVKPKYGEKKQYCVIYGDRHMDRKRQY